MYYKIFWPGHLGCITQFNKAAVLTLWHYTFFTIFFYPFKYKAKATKGQGLGCSDWWPQCPSYWPQKNRIRRNFHNFKTLEFLNLKFWTLVNHFQLIPCYWPPGDLVPWPSDQKLHSSICKYFLIVIFSWNRHLNFQNYL